MISIQNHIFMSFIHHFHNFNRNHYTKTISGKFIDHKCAGVSQWDLAASSGIYLNISHIFPNSTAEDLGSRLLVTTEACSLRVINQSHEVYSGACPNGYEYADPPDRSFESEVTVGLRFRYFSVCYGYMN